MNKAMKLILKKNAEYQLQQQGPPPKNTIPTWNNIKSFLCFRQSTIRESMLTGAVWVCNGFLYFRSSDLYKYLATNTEYRPTRLRFVKSLSDKIVIDLLQSHNAKAIPIRVKITEINPTPHLLKRKAQPTKIIKVWEIPEASIQEIPHKI